MHLLVSDLRNLKHRYLCGYQNCPQGWFFSDISLEHKIFSHGRICVLSQKSSQLSFGDKVLWYLAKFSSLIFTELLQLSKIKMTRKFFLYVCNKKSFSDLLKNSHCFIYLLRRNIHMRRKSHSSQTFGGNNLVFFKMCHNGI